MRDWPEIRDAVEKLCERSPGEYWRALDRERTYSTEFVAALTDAGYLSILVPDGFGGSGLPISAAAAVLEEIHCDRRCCAPESPATAGEVIWQEGVPGWRGIQQVQSPNADRAWLACIA